MVKLRVGSLIVQREDLLLEKPDIGLVTEIKNREEADRYIIIYWFGQGKFFSYLHYELGWFCGEEPNALWKIIL